MPELGTSGPMGTAGKRLPAVSRPPKDCGVIANMTSSSPEKDDVQKLAEKEAAVWESSRYYADAEEWTWLFWSDERPFLPLFRQLDLTYILEFACGHGRHSERILSLFDAQVQRITLMDILKSNIDRCTLRLGRQDKIRFLVNNGVSFRPVESDSLTAVFCYDAMVHFNREVVRAYLKDCGRVLVPQGKALLHHSNFSEDPDSNFGQNPHARAYMSASLFAKYAEEAGLEVLEQKVIHWGQESNLDCISLVRRT